MQPDQLEFWIDMNLPSSLADWIVAEYKIARVSFILTLVTSTIKY